MIDSQGTVDRDDAISVQPSSDGWQLTVYVADVASGVAPGGNVDREAFRRRESAYGGWRGTAKMLPRPVEERRTLAEGRACAAMAVRMKVGPDGSLGDVEVERATVHGAVAMDHSQVESAVHDADHPLHQELREAAAVSEVLLACRRAHGALALYDLLSGWATDEDGTVVRLASFERNVAYKIVQECMIAANTALAGWAAERDLPVLFRNHSAARVTPPRETFLEDLDLAFSAGTETRLQALQQRTLMTLRAAEYAPFMGGHWGLNLPGYLHGTSPLRRYADLVVQRIIFSHLDGTDTPYTQDELQGVAQALTEGARRDRQTEHESRKSSAHSRARSAAASSSADYSALDSSAFHAVLKRGCKEQVAGASLVEETARRAVGHQLTSLEQQLVLVVAGGPAWEPARTACMSAITAAPEAAVSVLSVHAQVNGLPLPEFTLDAGGQSHCPVFTSRASWASAEGRITGAERSAATKKAARHQAALSLLAVLAGLPDPSQNSATPAPVRAAPTAKAPAPAEGRSPVSALNELEQTRVISGLTYTYSSQGPGHQMVFACTAHATCDGHELSAGASASTKAAAKGEAAAALLTEISGARAKSVV
ncbi:RNB domain-containing ribonuclease [Streptomyces sp. NBC_01433]|uniref:RNB domain-containing ribonuclease n=1 Tax=Streptomyces sp. NBC_01433 TaxID=2903864 RepID=UPI0022561003|nr:RNB domain-containing ribonuclease [Streptomyces sp. NBC_01433]MCX4682076.1 RNB domain-containing ribonuclease [Streptomyces sp. NBC_01433]